MGSDGMWRVGWAGLAFTSSRCSAVPGWVRVATMPKDISTERPTASQANRAPYTTQASATLRVQSQGNPSGIYSAQSGMRTGFPRSNWISLWQSAFQPCPIFFSHHSERHDTQTGPKVS
jgi:hypothetical protein